MRAEEFLNDDLKGCYQIYNTEGVVLITGIEHSEICRIMEEYAQSYHKVKVESITFEEIEKYADHKYTVDDSLMFEKGATWIKLKLLNEI